MNMNLRLDIFGKECERLYREVLSEEVPKEECIAGLLLGGMELDFVPHVLVITTDSGKSAEIAVGWPDRDSRGVEFDFPDTREYYSVDQCEPLVAWLRLGLTLPDDSADFDDWRNESAVNWDAWEALVELYFALLDYEVQEALVRIKDDPAVRTAPEVAMAIARHDEQDDVDLGSLRDDICKTLQRYPEDTRKDLLAACYADPHRGDHLLSLALASS